MRGLQVQASLLALQLLDYVALVSLLGISGPQLLFCNLGLPWNSGATRDSGHLVSKDREADNLLHGADDTGP